MLWLFVVLLIPCVQHFCFSWYWTHLKQEYMGGGLCLFPVYSTGDAAVGFSLPPFASNKSAPPPMASLWTRQSFVHLTEAPSEDEANPFSFFFWGFGGSLMQQQRTDDVLLPFMLHTSFSDHLGAGGDQLTLLLLSPYVRQHRTTTNTRR